MKKVLPVAFLLLSCPWFGKESQESAAFYYSLSAQLFQVSHPFEKLPNFIIMAQDFCPLISRVPFLLLFHPV